MMTDTELLELAAKAAGVELTPMEVKNVSFQGDDRFIGYMAPVEQWPSGWFRPPSQTTGTRYGWRLHYISM